VSLPAQASDLSSLLSALGRERSASSRLRLVARSWNLLQQLSREERERVALALGSGWLWKRLERYFLADGELRPWELAVKRVLEQAGSAEPAELRQLASSLAGKDRRGLPDLLQSTLREVLAEEATLREYAAGAKQADAAEGIDEEGAAAGRPTRGSGDAAKVRRRRIAASQRVEVESAARAEAPAEPSPPVPASEPVYEQPAPPPERGPSARSATAGARPAPPRADPFAPRPAPAPAPPEPQRTGSRLPTLPAPSPTAPLSSRERLARLRALHVRPERATALGPEARAALLDALGPGWAARRALSQLLRSGAVSDLAEALALVERLRSPVQRSWCLGDLVAHWHLDAEEQQRVLDAAPSAGARRRLEQRLAARR
jgi:hypothetical protein